MNIKKVLDALCVPVISTCNPIKDKFQKHNKTADPDAGHVVQRLLLFTETVFMNRKAVSMPNSQLLTPFFPGFLRILAACAGGGGGGVWEGGGC